MSDAAGEVKDFIVENFLFGEDGHLAEDTSFLEAGIVDSTGIIELVGFIEARFGIHVEDEELVPENFDDLRKIDAYLQKKLGQGREAAT